MEPAVHLALQFLSLNKLNNFICNILEPIVTCKTQYDIQYLAVHVSPEAICLITETLRRNRKTVSKCRRRHDYMSENHDMIKQKHRDCYSKSSESESELVNRKRREKYSKAVGSPQHEKHLNRLKTYRKKKLLQFNGTFNRVSKFLDLVKNGPTSVCVICNQSLYLRSVLPFHKHKYQGIDFNVYEVVNKKSEICQTCHKSLKKGDCLSNLFLIN